MTDSTDLVGRLMADDLFACTIPRMLYAPQGSFVFPDWGEGRAILIAVAAELERLRAELTASESKLREIEAETREACAKIAAGLQCRTCNSVIPDGAELGVCCDYPNYDAVDPAAAIRSHASQGAPIPHDTERFSKLSNEPPARLPEGYSAPLDVRTTTELIFEAAHASQGEKK